MKNWAKLPSTWIEDGGLRAFRWTTKEPGAGASEVAALMALLAIAHHAATDTGIARLTYDGLETATGISRTKIADGLDLLAKRGIVQREPDGRSTLGLANYGEGHRWAAVPAKPLYDGVGAIMAFEDFHLRKRAELDALKLYFAIAARRDTEQNIAWLTYDKMRSYAGLRPHRIKAALGVLNINGLITVDIVPRAHAEHGVATGYRLRHLFPRRHAGTTGRASLGETTGF
ncbi:hypothetical protein [Paracoccus sediminicola]|uniref:hypothetical protein n=1 Tax=Paracoccus sediminicola TaxID=3017783 RepID=UPI0022F033D2|nr:hypothetical protein [Paracoccus sediminicola]WBU58816.1 hypothetical protein PAF18_17455 [Paracoccus sediminicola]